MMWALERGDALGDHLRAAIDEARFLSPILHGFARDLIVVRFVGLAEVRGVGVGNGTLGAHPVERGAGVEAA